MNVNSNNVQFACDVESEKQSTFPSYVCIKVGVQQIIPAPTDFSMNGSATVSLKYRITSCKLCSVGEPALNFFPSAKMRWDYNERANVFLW